VRENKILRISLSFLLAIITTNITPCSVFAANQEPLTVPVDLSAQSLPVTAPVEAGTDQPSGSASLELQDATDFLAGNGPLSRVDEEEQILLESNDPFYSTSGSWGQAYDDLWWLKRVRADQAWSYTRGAGSTVAVIDTGLDYNHPDIAGNLWSNTAEEFGISGVDDDGNGLVDDVHGWDFYNWDNDPIDDQGHGTHVAGIIGAIADNSVGIAGVAPESRILPIKVLSSKGSGFVTDVINAIYYAADLGAEVINMSLGVLKAFLSKSLRSAFERAVSYAKGKGTVVVAAAGNDASRVENSYPAGIRDVVAVGAIEPVTDQRAWFSNFGKLLDLMAPGVDVLSLKASGVSFGSSSVVDPNYVRASGTSMASPVVAGVVALMLSENPLLTYDQVVSRLRSSAVDLGASGFDIYYGYGLVDALGAVASAAASVASISESQNQSSFSKKRNQIGDSSAKAMDPSPALPTPSPGSARTIQTVLVPLSWYTGSVLSGSSVRKKDSYLLAAFRRLPGLRFRL